MKTPADIVKKVSEQTGISFPQRHSTELKLVSLVQKILDVPGETWDEVYENITPDEFLIIEKKLDILDTTIPTSFKFGVIKSRVQMIASVAWDSICSADIEDRYQLGKIVEDLLVLAFTGEPISVMTDRSKLAIFVTFYGDKTAYRWNPLQATALINTAKCKK